MNKIQSITASLAIAFASFTACASQLSSDFRGRVVDTSGRPVAGALIVVENLDTGHISRHVSGKTGRWHAQGKRSDSTYRVSCYAPGTGTPEVQFEGRVALGQAHVRNCLLGELGAHSPAFLSSWQWRQGPTDRYVLTQRPYP